MRYSPNKVIFDDASLLPAVFHMKADKTDFTAPNFGNISVFNLHSHVDHRNAKRRIAHAVRIGTSHPSPVRKDALC